MAYDIGPRIGIQGEAEFNNAINKINSSLKVLGSEMNAVTSAFGKNANSQQSLTSKNKVLSQQMDTQKGKLKLLNEQYNKQVKELDRLGSALEDAKKEHGENSEEVIKAQKAYDKQEASVKKLKVSMNETSTYINKLNDEYEDNAAALKKMGDGQSEAAKKAEKLKEAVKDIDDSLEGTNRELEEVDRLLKLDPTNTELLTQKQRLLAESVEKTKEKLKLLKQADEQAKQALSDGSMTQSQYDALQREIIETENNLKSLEKQAANSNTTLQQVASATEKFGEASTNLGKKLLPVTAGIGGMATAALKYGSDTQEAINKVDVSFGQAADAVHDFAEGSLEAYGISKGTALDMAALFGDMGTSMGIPQTEMSKMSTQLVGLAGDLASFKNIGLDQAQTALKSIFTGETESLKNLGVVMTQTNLDAYALANGFGKATSEMTESEKVMLRYQYVMDKTSNATGDFARNAGDSLSVNMTIFTESVKELAASFGEQLIPVVVPLVQKFTELVQWFGNLDDGTKQTIITVLGIVAALGPLLIVIGKISTGISALTKLAGPLGTAFKALTSPTGLIVLAIGAVIAVGVLLYQNWETVKQKCSEIWEAIKGVFELFSNWLGGVFANDWSKNFGFLGDILNGLLANISSVWEGIKQIFDGFITFFKGIFTGNWRQAFQGLVDIVKGIFNSIVSVVKAPINGVISIINGFIGGLNRIKIPSWIPVVGGKGINISKLPYLAQGGIVNRATAAVVGEDGDEAVIPLERNTGGITKIATMIADIMSKNGQFAASAAGAMNQTFIIESPVYLGDELIETNITKRVVSNISRQQASRLRVKGG